MIVYLITNKINGKRYVGQTKYAVEYRFKKHKQDALVAKRGYALHAAIRKYGIENFEIKVLSRCDTLEQANHREAYYIKLLNVLAPSGYNLRPGGDVSPHSEESKNKMSKSRMGIKNHNFGKHFTAEHRGKIAESNKGRGLGRKLSLETREKQSKSQTGKIKAKEHLEKISKSLTGVPQTKERKENIRLAFWKSSSSQSRIDGLIEEGLKTAKSILCHQNGKTYRSLHEAAKELGLQRQHIKGVIEGRSKFTKGYSFSYAKEDKK